jgi:hypothetical protein
MRQPRPETAAILLETHQTSTVKGLEVDRRIDYLKKLDLERFAEGQHTERPATGLVEVAEASLNDLQEAG